ncbi:hypothetical protein TIFTF001_046794 [Ficus carica]|uniref:Uncharacterized protein n=1 Tax=Ficus carica TaxID=3494 RepID=A0AA87ZJT6_FICCA|nr:hypothetical protein TIFTF001_046791 [Ficus carica]GMN34298.1 hypothetical protein TIFTF001_046794 [Ficus carica]
MANPQSILTEDDLAFIKGRFGFPNEVQLHLPFVNEEWTPCLKGGSACKELRKTPPKALLFKAKLERLLAQRNREWDEINIPHRLFGTSLFIERLSDERALITDLAFNMMKIDFPFPKEILARKRVEKEAVKAVAVAKTAKAA